MLCRSILVRAVVSTMTFRAAKEAHTVIPTTSRRVIDKAHEYLPVMVPKGARRAGAWNRLRAVATTLALAASVPRPLALALFLARAGLLAGQGLALTRQQLLLQLRLLHTGASLSYCCMRP